MSGDAPLSEGQIVTALLFSEPMRVETVRANGPNTWLAGLAGLQSEQFHRATEGLTRNIFNKARDRNSGGGRFQ